MAWHGQLVDVRLDACGHVVAFCTLTTHLPPKEDVYDFAWYALDGTLLSSFTLSYAEWDGHMLRALQLDACGHVVAFCIEHTKEAVFYWYLLDGTLTTGGTPTSDIWDLRLDACGHVVQFAIDAQGKLWIDLNGEAA